MYFVKGVSGVFDMLVLALLTGFMLRNIDPLFARVLRGTGSSPAGVVPFILPLSMMCAFGVVFDGVILIQVIVNGLLGWKVVVLALSVMARGVVCYVTLPLVRIMFDANYVPADMQARTDSGQLLQRRQEVPPPTSQFRPFSGAGQVLAGGSTASPV